MSQETSKKTLVIDTVNFKPIVLSNGVQGTYPFHRLGFSLDSDWGDDTEGWIHEILDWKAKNYARKEASGTY
jgi:hypothetical protein